VGYKTTIVKSTDDFSQFSEVMKGPDDFVAVGGNGLGHPSTAHKARLIARVKGSAQNAPSLRTAADVLGLLEEMTAAAQPNRQGERGRVAGDGGTACGVRAVSCPRS
jgi:hypothetical protein